MAVIATTACKNKPAEKTVEEKKADSMVKNDSQKAADILKYYQDKARMAPDSLPVNK